MKKLHDELKAHPGPALPYLVARQGFLFSVEKHR